MVLLGGIMQTHLHINRTEMQMQYHRFSMKFEKKKKSNVLGVSQETKSYNFMLKTRAMNREGWLLNCKRALI